MSPRVILLTLLFASLWTAAAGATDPATAARPLPPLTEGPGTAIPAPPRATTAGRLRHPDVPTAYSPAALLPAPPPVDFDRQIVTVWGLAGQPWSTEAVSFEDERARAWMHALHQAYEALLEIPLMEGITVRQALQMNAGLKERLGMVLLSARRTFYEPDQTGLVRCRLEVPFSGPVSLRSALYLAALRPQPQEPLALLASWSVLATATPLPDLASGPAVTRLVLDLRRTGFEPSLFPRFFSEHGHLLFQEAQIPGPERFSRPAIRFTQDIAVATAGKPAGEIAYLDARVAPLAHRDVTIAAAEESLFLAFCRRLAAEPLGGHEILIVHGNRRFEGGRLPRSAAPTGEKAAGTGQPAGGGRPAGGGTRPRR
ncbi:MAG: hypothetical protein OZSIB_0521 [Candidatus Ozemobacter sibiricus]|uniref:Uncharacterized protein n=1 Tax=Candidatus Ozemobacter sibiricus TaxID=2268124 RepID=A0A367ZLQ8_9BACT|nr:MAG: hypothetical protein OZSIB_0521 [Candidatus Ozemobacter sibiricus]